jgi:hypothetical protein
MTRLHSRWEWEHTLSFADGQNFPLAFADMNSSNGGDSEIIASE